MKEASLKRLYMIPNRWHSGKGETTKTVKKITGFQGFGVERRINRAQEIFKAYVAIIVDTWGYVFVKTHKTVQ